MSNGHVMPPNDPDVVVKPSGTSIGDRGVQSNSTETKINPSAIGTVAQDDQHNYLFQLAHTYGGDFNLFVTGVRIPFGAVRLEVLKLTTKRSQWKKGSTVLQAYTDRASRAWPEDLATPSTTTTNNQVFYTTAADPATCPATDWTAIPYANFVSMTLTTVTPTS